MKGKKLKERQENGGEATTCTDEQHKYPSISSNTSTSSSTKIKKEKKAIGQKKKIVTKKSKTLKSKDKKVISENSDKPGSSKRKRTTISDVYDDIEAKFSVMERAERVLSKLADEAPSFVKCMLPSNVACGFWLILPTKFCKMHLPSHDATIILVDEWGNEYKTSFLLDRHGLSAGWRGFSMSHRLLKGDILVFQLVEPCKFKVHIVRVNGLDVVDAALCLMNLDAYKATTESDLVNKDNRKRKRAKYAECFLLHVPKPQDNVKNEDNRVPNSELLPVTKQSGIDSDGFGSEVLEGSKISNLLQNNEAQNVAPVIFAYSQIQKFTSFRTKHQRKRIQA